MEEIFYFKIINFDVLLYFSIIIKKLQNVTCFLLILLLYLSTIATTATFIVTHHPPPSDLHLTLLASRSAAPHRRRSSLSLLSLQIFGNCSLTKIWLIIDLSLNLILFAIDVLGLIVVGLISYPNVIFI